MRIRKKILFAASRNLNLRDEFKVVKSDLNFYLSLFDLRHSGRFADQHPTVLTSIPDNVLPLPAD